MKNKNTVIQNLSLKDVKALFDLSCINKYLELRGDKIYHRGIINK